MGQYIPPSLQTSEQLKHHKHAKAQCRYREKNLETTHEKARQRMQRAPRTAESMAKAAEKCYAHDADHHESKCKRKFVARFGEDAFFDFYLPQHKLCGADFLPGLAREYAQQLEEHDRPVEKGGMKGGQNGKRVKREVKSPSAIKRPGSHPIFEARKDMVGTSVLHPLPAGLTYCRET
ncbi:hypothetical protein B0H14DRAFT_2632719 [Mycena olivaceomarginata]|nr:hypothetical protein B0H14DRAFT_2632719 [Mycena olivaceomarginata]